MTSKVQIFNMALAHIGVSSFLSSDTELRKEANLCRAFYDHCLDLMLKAHPWSFARKRVTLGLLVDDPPTNWGYAYAYPSDCVQALSVVTIKRIPRNDEKPPFEICRVGTARAIATDIEDAELIYTSRVVDEAQFDAPFVEALSYLLGANICLPMNSKPEIANQCRQAYNVLLSQAAAADFSEGFDGPEPDGEIISSRL